MFIVLLIHPAYKTITGDQTEYKMVSFRFGTILAPIFENYIYNRNYLRNYQGFIIAKYLFLLKENGFRSIFINASCNSAVF